MQLILLITQLSSSLQFDIDILSAITSFTACIGLCPLVLLEHSRSIRPSDLSVIYLCVTLTCDSVDLGTAVYDNSVISAALPVIPLTLNIFFKFVLLVIESRGKENILRDSVGNLAPEETAGILSRAFFWWINPILAQGRRNILTEDSLPSIDYRLSSRLLRHRALLAWEQRGQAPVI